MNTITIKLANALAGAGKTRWLVSKANKMALRGEKVIIVQPSMLLIESTIKDELLRHNAVANYTAIHSNDDTYQGKVKLSIMEHLTAAAARECKGHGEILFVTHTSLLSLPHFHAPKRWNLIMDEIPQTDSAFHLNLPETHGLLTSLIDLEDHDGVYSRIVIKERARLVEIAENANRDRVWDIFNEFVTTLLSGKWDVFVNTAKYMNLVHGTGDDRSFDAWGILRPTIFEGFRSVTLTAACADASLLARHWDREFKRSRSCPNVEVQFKPLNLGAKDGLRYGDVHPHGDKVTFYYITEEGWSKALRDKEIEIKARKGKVIDFVVDAVRDLLEGEQFCWMGNKDLPDTLFRPKMPEGLNKAEKKAWRDQYVEPRQHRLPNTPHGLNEYDNINHVVVLSALNLTPMHGNFLAQNDVAREEVSHAITHQATYQALMRGGMRDLNNLDNKINVVPDRACAEWLQTLFPGSTVAQLPWHGGIGALKKSPGRPRQHESDAARKKAQRAEADRRLALSYAAKAINDLRNLVKPNAQSPVLPTYLANETIANMPELRNLPENVPDNIGLSCFASVGDKIAFEHLDYNSPDHVVEALRFFWKDTVAKKDATGLFSTAYFDPDMNKLGLPWEKDGDEWDKERSRRGLENIRYMSPVIMLDNDGGDLTPERFVQMFPYYRIVIMNTYNTNASNKRWRAVMFASAKMTVELHGLVMAHFQDTLRSCGFYGDKELEADAKLTKPKLVGVKRHGFDESKFTASSLFYFPSQAGRGAEHSFFLDHNDERRGVIDLEQFIAHLKPKAEYLYEPKPVEPKPQPVVPAVNANASPALKAVQQKLVEQAQEKPAALREARVQAAIDAWAESAMVPKVGNKEFHRLATRLQAAGLDLQEIEAILDQEAWRARHPDERRHEIRNIMRSLRKAA